MNLWADIYDSSGNRLGGGPVPLRDAAVTRRLDGVGSIQFSVPGTDQRAVDLLVNEAHARIYYQANEAAGIRELGRGVIRRIRAAGSVDNWSLICDGPDDLDALTRVSTLLGRKFSAKTVSQISTTLVGLVSGWSASASGGNTTDSRFDGMSVFKALLALAEQQGLHVRAGSSANVVEIGAFGSDSGLRLVNAAQMTPALEANDDVLLIESLNVEKNSEAVCNRLYPLGAGIGEAWLTLEDATRSTPYTVQSTTGPDGKTLYYLQDSASVSAFGVIEKVGKFSQIAPLSNSAADMENAANALYDISAAWLQRYALRQDVYDVTARKGRTSVRPGDQIQLIYKGLVTRDGEVVAYVDLDQAMWVLEATERVGIEGAALDLKLATVDRHEMDAAQIVIGALEELQIDGVSVKPYFNRVAWVYFNPIIAPLYAVTMPVRFGNATQRLNRCLVHFSTKSFVSPVSTAVTNTTHHHPYMSDGGYPSGPPYGPFEWKTPSMNSGVYLLAPFLAEYPATYNLPFDTGVEDNEDFITLQFAPIEDTQTPTGIRLYVDGVDRTTALGGPWAPSDGEVTIEDLDITAYILASTLQQEHTVQLQCTLGQGAVTVTIEVYETIQSISV